MITKTSHNSTLRPLLVIVFITLAALFTTLLYFAISGRSAKTYQRSNLSTSKVIPGKLVVVLAEEANLKDFERFLNENQIQFDYTQSDFKPMLYFRSPTEGVEKAMDKMKKDPLVESTHHNRDISVSVRFTRGTTKSQALDALKKAGYLELLEEIFTYRSMTVTIPVGQEEAYIQKIRTYPETTDVHQRIDIGPLFPN